MRGTLEELLTEEELAEIEKVLAAPDLPFSELVKLTGLDPSADFRYANLQRTDFRFSDLRGYDFTGADLRSAIRDETTKDDSTTIYDGSEQLWLPVSAAPIIELMAAAQRTEAREVLRPILDAMVRDHPFSSSHIDLFLAQEIRRTKTLERAVTLADFLSPSVSLVDRPDLRDALAALVTRKGALPKRKTGRRINSDLESERVLRLFASAHSRVLKEAQKVVQAVVLRNASYQDQRLGGRARVTLGEISEALRLGPISILG